MRKSGQHVAGTIVLIAGQQHGIYSSDQFVNAVGVEGCSGFCMTPPTGMTAD